MNGLLVENQTCRIYPRAQPTGWGKFYSLVREIFYFNGRFCTSGKETHQSTANTVSLEFIINR